VVRSTLIRNLSGIYIPHEKHILGYIMD